MKTPNSGMQRPSPSRLLLIIIVVAVVLRIVTALLLGDRIEVLPGIHDQLSYDALAQSLLAGKGYQFESGWYPFTPPHTPTAHWSFAYPAYLAAVYAIAGYHPLLARVIQAILAGILMPWLLYRLGSRLFERRVGLAAAALSAVYGYLIYHNAALMTETFYILAILVSFDVAYEMVESGGMHRWWLLGIFIGLAVLLRQAFLFFVPFLLGWLFLTIHRKSSVGRLALVAGVVALCILPWTLRNAIHYRAFLLLNSNSGYALYTSNHPDQGVIWRPDYTAPIPADLVGLNEAQLDRELSARGMRFVLANSWRYSRLTLSRIPYHFRFWPTPDSGMISNLVRMGSFGIYLPFIVAGLVLSRRDWRRLLPFYLFAVVTVGIHVLTWPGPRYRFPVDAMMMLFAGLAVLRLAERLHLRIPAYE